MNNEIVTRPDESALDQVLDDSDSEAGYIPQMVRVEIIHGAGQFSIAGMPAQARLSAVILVAKRTRLLFPTFGNKQISDDITTFTDRRPFCASENATTGKLVDADFDNINNPSKDAILMLREKISQGGLRCSLCPFSKFGSVEMLGVSGKGCVCKEMRRLLLWRGVNIPIVMSIPSSSIRNWDSYCSSLSIVNKQYNKVQTEITADIKQMGSNKWSIVNFSFKDDITPEMIGELLKPVLDPNGLEMPLAKAMINQFTRVEVAVEDYIGADTNGNGKEDF